MSGGVRNLRAMFENKDESSTSPPDRGRSPVGSIGGGSNGTSPRPLSKVRTSFVAVERSGQLGSQWGLRKENNPEPSLATRRGSFSIDEESAPKAMAEKNETIKSELLARKNSAVIAETIPENALETPTLESEKKASYLNGKGARGKAVSAEAKPIANPDKKISIQQSGMKHVPAETINNAVLSGGAALDAGSGFDEALNGNTESKLKASSSTKSAAKTALAGRSTKPTPISTTSPSTTSKASSKTAKSPAISITPTTTTTPGKTPTTPGKSSKLPATKSSTTLQPIAQTKTLEKKASRASLSSATSSRTAPRPATSSTAAAGTLDRKVSEPSPSSAFHKPRPKSPTKPAKLPASMTAPTASSLSKVATAASTSSRQSLAPTNKAVSRSPSRTSLGPKQELRHKSSKLDNERPALGRPPAASLRRQPSRQSLPKQSPSADEGFLARMMRPTTSSASKTIEKVITPPRVKAVSRPTTRDGIGHHKAHEGLKGSPSTKNLPPMPKTSRAEETAEAVPAEQPAMASVILKDESSSIKKDTKEDILNTDKESVIASERKPMEKAPAANDATITSEPTTTSGNAEKVEANDKQAKVDTKAADAVPMSKTREAIVDKAVVPEESKASIEKSVISEEPKASIEKSVDTEASVEETAVRDEPKIENSTLEEVTRPETAASMEISEHTKEDENTKTAITAK